MLEMSGENDLTAGENVGCFTALNLNQINESGQQLNGPIKERILFLTCRPLRHLALNPLNDIAPDISECLILHCLSIV